MRDEASVVTEERPLAVILDVLGVSAVVGRLARAIGVGSSRPTASGVFEDPRAAKLGDAIVRRDDTLVRTLVRDTDLAVQGRENLTLLQWALFNQRASGLSALLEAGANASQPGLDGSTVIHDAAAANDPAYLDLLLAHGADPNAPHGITCVAPIADAMMAGRTAQFHRLLEAGADPGRPDRMGNTPLHVAAKINRSRLVLALLEAGAPPEARNRQDATFAAYLTMTPENLLTAKAASDRRAVFAWLRAHAIPIDEGGRPR